MFEALFPGPIALARQHESPFPEERRQFLRHLNDLGYAHNTLRAVACELVVIVRRLDLSGDGLVDPTVVDAAAEQWATEQMRRHRSRHAAISTRNFRYWATQWLRFLGRLQKPAPVVAPPFQGLLDGFTSYMSDEQGFSPYSVRSHGWKTKTFLAWYWPQGHAFADVTIQDVDDFLMAKGCHVESTVRDHCGPGAPRVLSLRRAHPAVSRGDRDGHHRPAPVRPGKAAVGSALA